MMKSLIFLFLFTLLGNTLSQAIPQATCTAGYSGTVGPCGSLSQADCVAIGCTNNTAGADPVCSTVNGQLYCAYCCLNSDYIVWPDSSRLMGSSLFDVNDIIDVIYVIETVDSNGVSTNCSCLTPDNWFAHHENVTISGEYDGGAANGTQARFEKPDLAAKCSQSTTTCFLTVHANDGLGPAQWGSPLVTSPTFNIAYGPNGIEQGFIPSPIPSSTSLQPIPSTVVITTVLLTTTPTVTSPSPTSPSPTATSSTPPSPGKLSSGDIAGIAVGSVVGLVLIVAGALALYRRQRRKSESRTVYVTSNVTSDMRDAVPGSPDPMASPKFWGGS